MTERKKKIIITTVVIALGITFVAIGVSRGENREVLRKAVNICMECIGIG